MQLKASSATRHSSLQEGLQEATASPVTTQRNGGAMTAGECIAKWRSSELKERSSALEHFPDLCRPARRADPDGGRSDR